MTDLTNTSIPIPKVVRWGLENHQPQPITVVDTTCVVVVDDDTRHDGPAGGYGYCACGCFWVAGILTEPTEQFEAIRKALDGGDGCGCP